MVDPHGMLLRVTNTWKQRQLQFVIRDHDSSRNVHIPNVERIVLMEQNATQQFTLPIPLVNAGKEPALAEISLDWGTDGTGQALPFAVSRPLLRLGAGQRAKVEVLYQGQGLPTDRETYLFDILAGTMRSEPKIPASTSSRGSGTPTTPVFGSIVAKG